MFSHPKPRSTLPTNPFIFPTGTVNLLITYDGEPLLGSVSADALVLASPVWKNFLFPPWDTGSTSETDAQPKEMDCSEDDGAALLVLMNIIHLNFSEIPTTLDYASLLQVAVLVDQYDCIKIVRPWLEGWMKNERDESIKVNQDNWLFIAWIFGREATFSDLALHIVKSSETSYPRRILAGDTGLTETDLINNEKPLTDPMPPGILESIMKCRIQALAGLIQLPFTRLTQFENAMRSSNITVCTVNSNSKVCDAAVYGSLIFALTEKRIPPYPRPAADTLDCSVDHLGQSLIDVQLHYIKPMPPTATTPMVAPAAPDNSSFLRPTQPFSFNTSGRPQATPQTGGFFGGGQPPSGLFGRAQATPQPRSLFGGNVQSTPHSGTPFGGSPPAQQPSDFAFGQPNASMFAQNHVAATPIDKQDSSELGKTLGHSNCAISMWASVRAILGAIESPVLDSHRRHMQIQRGEAIKPVA